MFTLNKYVDSILDLASKEKDSEKRKQAIKAWIEMLGSHHRELEGKKILSLLDAKKEELGEKALVYVSDEREQKLIENFFEKKNIPVEIVIKPDNLGGVKIIWNNMLVDNTVKSQLDKLKRRMSGMK